MSEPEVQLVEPLPKAATLPTDLEKLAWDITLFLAVSTVLSTLVRMF